MKISGKRKLLTSVGCLSVFVLWTVLVRFTDVQAIGADGTSVGLATLNGTFHRLIGVNMTLYTATDLLGLVPFLFVFGFAAVGLVQLIKRKRLAAVDRSILILGAFYITVMGAYLLFEAVPLNFRPILIDGRLEASYPSSTTLLTLTVMPTTAFQLRHRIKNRSVMRGFTASIYIFSVLMLVGRLLSGVHWITDIIGGILLSGGLVSLYSWAVVQLDK